MNGDIELNPLLQVEKNAVSCKHYFDQDNIEIDEALMLLLCLLETKY